MSNVKELFASKIFITNQATLDSLDPVTKKHVLVYNTATSSLYRSDGKDWILASNHIQVLSGEKETWSSGIFNGQIGVDLANSTLYIWNNDSWVECGGSTKGSASITIVSSLEDAPVFETTEAKDAAKGSLILVEDSNTLYWFNGEKWLLISERIVISEVNNAMGRFIKGEPITGKTNQEMWSMLLTSHLVPTITPPSASITLKNGTATVSNGALFEVNSTLANLSLTASYSDGEVAQTWGGITTQSESLAGDATSYTFSGISLETSNGTACPISSSYKVIEGTQGSWGVSVAYSEGTHTPIDNDGKPYKGSYSSNFTNDKTNPVWAAGTVNSSTVSIFGVYPIYGTTVLTNNSLVLTKQALQKKPAPNAYFTLAMKADQGPGNTRWQFAVPATWTIKAIRNAGGTPFGGTDASSLAQWSTETKDRDINGTNVSYTTYTRDQVSDAPGEQTIRVVLA